METFSFAPDYSWQIAFGHEVLVTEFESGKEQRRYKRRKAREWQLSFSGKWDVLKNVVSFWNERKGPFEVFLWNVPDSGETITARFKEEDLNVPRNGLKRGSLQLTLREVL